MPATDDRLVRCFAAVAAIAAVLAAGTACRRKPAAPPAAPSAATAVDTAAPRVTADTFTAPATLAELARQVTWIDRPVHDPLEHLREQEAREPPADTVADALAMPNASPEANARIAAALFRAPAADAAAAVPRVERRLAADVDSLNPILADTTGEFDLLGLTGVCLLGLGRDLEPFANADVVASWQASADGLVDKLVLRGDLAWSDGTPLTARDVAFTWRLVVDPRVPARAFRAAARRLREVRAYDDRTVVFFHAEPSASAARSLDFPVLPRHAYGRTWERDPTLVTIPEHAALEARPVTAGPYEVASRTPGREIVLRRRAAWAAVRGRPARRQPPFAAIRFRVFEDPSAALAAVEAGELDETVLAPREWITATSAAAFADRAVRVATAESRSLLVAWNGGSPFFGDRRVRRAMGYAFDHDRMLETVCCGLATPATGPFAPGPWCPSPGKPEPGRHDLDKAEALLDEAGWIDRDGDGVRDREIDGRVVPFEFRVLCDLRPSRVETCELLRESLARVGVTCVVHAVAADVLRDHLRGRRFEACLVSWGDAADPDAAESLWGTDGPRNSCGYSNPAVDRLFAEGRRDRDQGRRAEKYARIQEILREDQPCTWLLRHEEFRGLSRRIGGLVPALRGPAHWTPGLSSIWQPTLE